LAIRVRCDSAGIVRPPGASRICNEIFRHENIIS
jgi:hypothetical protein